MSVIEDAGSIVELVDYISKASRRTEASLSGYTKKTNIISRVYLEESLTREDITIPLMGTLNQLYITWVLTALNLDRTIAGGKTVREVFGVVSSENYNDPITLVSHNFKDEDWDKQITSYSIEAADPLVELEKDSQRFAAGRLIEIEFAIGEKMSIKAYLYVQLIPYVITTDIAQGFFSANFTPSFMTRWKQYKAGEISFWKDFVFAADLIKNHKETLKNDTDGVLYDMLSHQRNALAKWFFGMFSNNHNSANAIIVVDISTFRKVCNEAHIDFKNASVRQSFFRKTFTTALVVVDTMYGSVEMYFNGIDTKGTYTFDMINKVGAKGAKDSVDMKDLMKSFSQGMSPKF